MSGYLCEELIAEILERLPVKSIVRFMSLSKSWRSRICTREFIQRHTLRSLQSPNIDQRVIVGHLADNYGRIKLTFHSEDQLDMSTTCGYKGLRTFKLGDLSFVGGSCNGLICLVGQHSNCRTSISLWNPSIRRKLTLPDHPSLNEPYNFKCGIGFDPITHDYKFVIIPRNAEVGRDSYVYTLKTDSWCKIDTPVSLYSYAYPTSRGYFVNGILHWLVTKSEGWQSHFCILTFNLSTQIFGTIALPERRGDTIIAIIKGSLAVVTTSCSDNRISIWVMKDYNNAASWCEVYNLDNRDSKEFITSAFQLKNGDFVFMNYFCEHIEIYNLSKNVCNRLAKMEYVSKQYCVETYVDSLALLDRGSVF